MFRRCPSERIYDGRAYYPHFVSQNSSRSSPMPHRCPGYTTPFQLAGQRIDEITGELIAAYVATRNAVKLEISSINRELQVLRRMFNLAYEWKVVERPLDRVRMLKGEDQRDRVLTSQEEKRYLGQAAPLLHDVATVLVDCSLRPEECFRLKPVHVQHGNLEIPWGEDRERSPKNPDDPSS